jgi:CheY-like chemotaxis protein
MSKRILVVEDQEDNRQIIRDMLAPTDYEITEVESGEEALTAIARQRPDLILMDIRFCAKCELELGTARPTQSQTTKPQDALEMGKEHSTRFPIVSRLFKSFGLGERPDYVPRFLIDGFAGFCGKASLDSTSS